MEYLKRVLGIDVTPEEWDASSLPALLHERYRLQKVRLGSVPAVFAYPKGDLDPVNFIQLQFQRIQVLTGATAVLVLNRLTWSQKEALLKGHIPFVVDGRQIYLPFLGTYLQERGDGDVPHTRVLLPISQMLLLALLYHGCRDLPAGDAARLLSVTSTSISGASKQLENFGLIRTKKQGKGKIICSDRTPRELFDAAQKHLVNPVKRTVYVQKTDIDEKLLVSGEAALSVYSGQSLPPVECYAAGRIVAWEKKGTEHLLNSDEQCAVQLWRYDPKRLSDGDCVDKLSLCLALREAEDENVKRARDEMLEQLWKEIDAKKS